MAIIGDVQLGRPGRVFSSTKALIEARIGLVGGELAYALDTHECGFYNGTEWKWFAAPGGGGGGVTDHGDLTGLQDDDHYTVYFNQTRGDARYALVGHTHGAGGDIAGWTGLSGSWSYQSAAAPVYTIQVDFDATGIIWAGMKLRLTHSSTVKYFIVISIAVGAGYTDVVVYGGTDYTLSASAITDVSVSAYRTPYGFPMNVEKWQVVQSISGSTIQADPTNGVWYNLTGCSLVVPPGVWNLSWSGTIFATNNGTIASVSVHATLSVYNNSESDTAFSVLNYLNVENPTRLTLDTPAYRTKMITLAAATTYYLNFKAPSSGMSYIGLAFSAGPCRIVATCAYL